MRVIRQKFTLEDAIVPTPARLKLLQASDQWHFPRVSTHLTSSHCKLRPNTEGQITTGGQTTAGLQAMAADKRIRLRLRCSTRTSSSCLGPTAPHLTISRLLRTMCNLCTTAIVSFIIIDVDISKCCVIPSDAFSSFSGAQKGSWLV